MRTPRGIVGALAFVGCVGASVVAAILAEPALSPGSRAAAAEIEPRRFPDPPRTAWRPRGCRSVPFTHGVLLPRTAFRRAHGDLESSDEVLLAYPPVFAREWVAEPGLYQVTTPSFDSAGNLYMTPLLPHEPILMISLEPERGERRFVLPLAPGQRGGGVVPLVLRDPERGVEVVYVNAYERVIAITTDGAPVWETPTGLGPAATAQQSPIGLAYVPSADAIVALTRDGHVVLLDRRSGAPLLDAPLALPGELTPPVELDIAPAIAAGAEELLRPFVNLSPGSGLVGLIQVLLGGSSEVANNLSVDPRTGRLWIAASARDAEDGRADGLSELGAIYRYDVVRDGAKARLVEVCHHTFSGGSASTPTIGRDGERIYLGDDAGALIAIEAADCREAWSVPLDSQIFGSVAASSDNREIYAASATGLFQIFDDGARGRRGWTASLDVYDVPPGSGLSGMNLLLAGVGANGLLIHAGVGLATGGRSLPVRTGIVHVDRATGRPRWFADGFDESLGAMSTGPDGVLYLPHAPLRRAFAVVVGLSDDPLVGGISKWSPARFDLLARDAACAAEDRARNALRHIDECPESAAADAEQIAALRAQVEDAAARAVAAGELGAAEGERIRQLVEAAAGSAARAFAAEAAGDAAPRDGSLETGADRAHDALGAAARAIHGGIAGGGKRKLGSTPGRLATELQQAARALGRACRLLAKGR